MLNCSAIACTIAPSPESPSPIRAEANTGLYRLHPTMGIRTDPVCPDCTYLLTGLRTPCCPECGLQFDPRLLEDPSLARPRPAWERRPHVSRLAAIWQTVFQVTFRPGQFFTGIQQPDRLRRSLYWVLTMIGLVYVVVAAYIFLTGRYGGPGGGFWGLPRLQQWGTSLLLAAFSVFSGCVLVLFPMAVMLLGADVLLWRDRARYRLFFKGALYSSTVYLWLAVAICAMRTVLTTCFGYGAVATIHDSWAWPWVSWVVAGGMSWHYALIYHAGLGKRFAVLLPTCARRRNVLALLVVMTWLGAMYLTLFDYHIGLRFVITDWTLDCI
ncbi:MAG: hypothetical protein GY842_23380 [bacterium]|nr:hypothetical protein [bacterium]